MSRQVREMMESELRAWYAGVQSALVLDVSKLDGVQANQVRGKLRQSGYTLHVVKNRTARRVFAGSPLEPVGKALKGPCALLTGGSTIVEAAKALMTLVKDYPGVVLKGGLVEGVSECLPVEEVARMRTRLEVIGDIAAAMRGPSSRLSACMGSPAGKIAGCVKGIVKRLEKGEAVQKVA
ncbi:MAG: 50S ribosomal protein L10 [Phycisphaerae bacterium]|nr:50S ribosomal protein L10 [Phycisphaerae bacterium]NUQ45621.1 50S ribosomal protein L10 [Phycisphaerae bacterium]